MEMKVRSLNGLLIRLPEERWVHILDEHAELAGLQSEILRAVAEPERLLVGDLREFLALRTRPDGKVLVAVYRELDDDGFVITALLTRRIAALNRKTQIWPLPT